MQNSKVISHIVNWLTAYCEQSKMEGFAVGISGGIDSALTSTLCAKTGKKVIVLNLPILQHKEQDELAKKHINWLKKNFANVSSEEIDLTKTFLQFSDLLPKNITAHKLTMGNTRSRFRMITLYVYAGANKLLVAGTGNKVEDFGVGFFTKYGDGGVDISPIADLMKSEVYALAKEVGVIESILKAPPTDGLWKDKRTDEDQIGASYDELEWAMKYYSFEFQVSSFKLNKRQEKVLKIYKRFNTANAHKMQPIPFCLIPKKLKVTK